MVYRPPSGYRLPVQPYSRFGYDGQLWIPGSVGKRLGILPGEESSDGPLIPALFLSGQSNAGNQDSVPGSIAGGVLLSWSQVSSAITGPIPMALQGGGHSFEWQCSSNMALHYSSPVTVAKYWADGTLISQWLPTSLTLWVGLAKALEAFALRCLAEGITQVEFGWSQGESNCTANQSATLATFEAYTNDVFDSVKYLLEAFGLTVHFTIIKTNSNIVTGPNPGDVSAVSLAFVRAAQDNLAVTRSDTSTLSLDSIVPASAGAVHYINGQTNTGGAIWATDIFTRYVSPQPALLTPPTIETIMGANLLFDYDSRSIAGLVDNDPISLIPDSGPGAHNITIAGNARPFFKANSFGSIPGILFDGIDDTAVVPGVSIVAPGTAPFFSIFVGRQKTWTLNDRIFGATNNFNLSVYQSDATPKLSVSNASSFIATPFTLNTFGRVENKFSNNASDYIQILDVKSGTGNLGNTAPGAVAMAQTNGGGFGNVEYLRWFVCNATPTKIQNDKIRGNGIRNYTGTVWGYM